MAGNNSLTDFLMEVLELKWSEFNELMEAEEFTALEATIIALITVCAKGNLRAIQEAFDRTDGKVAKQIQVELPKFYILYPNATTVADDPAIIEVEEGPTLQLAVSPAAQNAVLAPETEPELPTTSLRETLDKMIRVPLSEVNEIIQAQQAIDQYGDRGGANPRVKSVIVANLLHHMLTAKKPMGYILEVMEQIDGKVADKIKLLGQDVFIKRFEAVAPAGAKKNADGVYFIAEDNITNAWALRLDSDNAPNR